MLSYIHPKWDKDFDEYHYLSLFAEDGAIIPSIMHFHKDKSKIIYQA